MCWLEPTEVVLPVDCTSESSGDEDRRGHQAAAGALRIPARVSSFRGWFSSLSKQLIKAHRGC